MGSATEALPSLAIRSSPEATASLDGVVDHRVGTDVDHDSRAEFKAGKEVGRARGLGSDSGRVLLPARYAESYW